RQIFMDTDPDPANRINFNNGHVFRIDLAYDGATLTETVTDTVTGATFSTSYDVDIAAHVGSNVGYVGLSGGAGGQAAVQDVLTGGVDSDAPSSPGGGPSAGGAGIFAQLLTAGDAALLLSGPSAPGGFSLNTGVPVASPPESRTTALTDLTAALKGSGPPASSTALPSDVAGAWPARAHPGAYRDALDQLFGSEHLLGLS